MDRFFILSHINTFSILLFLSLYGLFIYFKPAYLYNSDGSIKQFGVGYKSKTVVPLWIIAILLGIVSYTCMLYAATSHRIIF